jgi:hypothetical protein
MKSICIVAIAVCSGLLVAYGQPLFKESIEQQIIAKEREELEALKRGDLNAFANFIADEAVFVNAQGPDGKAQVVKNVADFKLLDFQWKTSASCRCRTNPASLPTNCLKPWP